MLKFLINIVAFYWMIILYLMQNSIYINYDKYFMTVVYFVFGLIISAYSLYKLILTTEEKESVSLKIAKINPAYTEYMPIYLAITVIAFELNPLGKDTFSIVIINIFIYMLFYISNIAYMNPAWFLFGYRVYKIEKDSANYILIIHKNENYKSIEKVDKIYKIDEYTFIKPKEK